MLFKQPQKPFQLLKMDDVLGHIKQLALIIYAETENYFFTEEDRRINQSAPPFERQSSLEKEKFSQKRKPQIDSAQIFSSFPLTELDRLEQSFFLSYSMETAKKRGAKLLLQNKNDLHTQTKKFSMTTLANKPNNFKKYLRNFEEVPFFLPRTGINRTLQSVGLGSNLMELSKKVLCKRSKNQNRTNKRKNF